MKTNKSSVDKAIAHLRKEMDKSSVLTPKHRDNLGALHTALVITSLFKESEPSVVNRELRVGLANTIADVLRYCNRLTNKLMEVHALACRGTDTEGKAIYEMDRIQFDALQQIQTVTSGLISVNISPSASEDAVARLLFAKASSVQAWDNHSQEWVPVKISKRKGQK